MRLSPLQLCVRSCLSLHYSPPEGFLSPLSVWFYHQTHLVCQQLYFCSGVNILQTCGKCGYSHLGCFKLSLCLYVCLVLAQYTLKSLCGMPCRGHCLVSICVCECCFFLFLFCLNWSRSLSSVSAVKQRQTGSVLMTMPYVLQIQRGG